MEFIRIVFESTIDSLIIKKWYGLNRSRRGGKNTQNYTKKILMVQITMVV